MDIGRYIGVEQEFVSFKKNEPDHSTSFGPYFKKMRANEEAFFKISETSIRTGTGHATYVDQSEIEVCTPPVRINTGFATRLSDLVMIGREKIINAVPELNHTGYSMHWNISKYKRENEFYAGIALPFHLFGLTPLSSGLNMRKKTPRVEFLGDYITDEDQIRSLALLFGAYSYAFVFHPLPCVEPSLPISMGNHVFTAGSKNEIFLQNGRFSPVHLKIPDLGINEMVSAQKYLEYFYQWIEPFAKQLGTHEEVSNLESFIFGDKKLEFDKFKYFAHLLDSKGKKGAIYCPLLESDQEFPSKTLRHSGKERTLPLEGKLLGSIVKNIRGDISSMNWDNIIFNDGDSLNSIDEIYSYAMTMFEKDSNLEPSPQVTDFSNPPGLKLLEQRGPSKYDYSKDIFKSDLKYILSEMGRVVKSNTLTKTGLKNIWAYGLMGFALGTGIAYQINNQRINERFEQLQSQYTIASTNTPSISTNTPAISNILNNTETKK